MSSTTLNLVSSKALSFLNFDWPLTLLMALVTTLRVASVSYYSMERPALNLKESFTPAALYREHWIDHLSITEP
jgi:peptidoglycan/LPS O-acetylase OafA/YrhL